MHPSSSDNCQYQNSIFHNSWDGEAYLVKLSFAHIRDNTFHYTVREVRFSAFQAALKFTFRSLYKWKILYATKVWKVFPHLCHLQPSLRSDQKRDTRAENSPSNSVAQYTITYGITSQETTIKLSLTVRIRWYTNFITIMCVRKVGKRGASRAERSYFLHGTL